MNVDSLKAARRLFRYAADVATKFVLIELIDGGEVVKSHLVLKKHNLLISVLHLMDIATHHAKAE